MSNQAFACIILCSMVVDFRVAYSCFSRWSHSCASIVGVCALVVVGWCIPCMHMVCRAYGCNLLRSLTWKTFFMKVNKILDRTFDELQIIFSQWISKLEVKLDNFYQTWCIQILRTSVWKIQLKQDIYHILPKTIKFTDFSEKSYDTYQILKFNEIP